jgi:hypothetical protein
MKIVRYLTASNPQANKERISLELRCLEIDQVMIGHLIEFVKKMISIDQDVFLLSSDDLKV